MIVYYRSIIVFLLFRQTLCYGRRVYVSLGFRAMLAVIYSGCPEPKIVNIVGLSEIRLSSIKENSTDHTFLIR
ncbi:Uncharacterized protein BM_BM17624 [Brugia malayi]|uniref:Secreted protein n=1 Tax=Brugia malayi TaxID=6279 RepID=A0A4E9FGZ1_BRUMA|nr:Uncharacterized protein BM_BM17624 [Brugia malayi]VIO95762.1 Uncharacterized protein BM_BM17624 [Brugia malayi]